MKVHEVREVRDQLSLFYYYPSSFIPFTSSSSRRLHAYVCEWDKESRTSRTLRTADRQFFHGNSTWKTSWNSNKSTTGLTSLPLKRGQKSHNFSTQFQFRTAGLVKDARRPRPPRFFVEKSWKACAQVIAEASGSGLGADL
jgi:hypothetical protein